MIDNNQIDLTPFCLEPPPLYRALIRPWSGGGYTWACDGPILIRVPERPDVPGNEIAPTKEALGRPWPAVPPKLYRVVSIPEQPPFESPHCEDPDCLVCKTLSSLHSLVSGLSSENVGVGIRMVGRSSLQKLIKLPDLLLAARTGAPSDALYFTFRGGEGLLSSPAVTIMGGFEDLQFAELEEAKEE